MALWDLSAVAQQVTLTPVTPLVLALREARDAEIHLADVHRALQVPVAAFGELIKTHFLFSRSSEFDMEE